MKKILRSIFVLTVVAGLTVAATSAFFSDTETSTDNLLQAGSLDLKVDNTCHYLYYVGGDTSALGLQGYEDVGCAEEVRDEEGNLLFTTSWEETDLVPGVHKLIWFDDVKPGDIGEDTISLHVYDNDAWGRAVLSATDNYENGCTEPEAKYPDPTCGDPDDAGQGLGELQNYLRFTAWLDQGSIPGFQNVKPDGNGGYINTQEDQHEGDNIWQGPVYEPQIADDAVWEGGLLTFDFAPAMRAWWNQYCADLGAPNGHNEYGICHGLAEDGRMVASTTYYFGLLWKLPPSVGNIVQTDSVVGDLTFEVVQHRNNPNPWNN